MPNKTPPRVNSAKTTGSKFRLSAHNISPTYTIGALLLAGLIAFIAWWFFTNFERVTNTDYQLRAQAQYNPYYAAELLINSQHGATDPQNIVAMTLLDADLKTLLNDLPPLNEGENEKQPTFIINSMGSKLTDERFEQLRSWVEQGGHVITFTADGNSYKDMQAVLARLKELQSEQDVTDLTSDAKLAELIGQLNTGNQFLTQLGIYSVAPESDSSNPDNDEVAEIGEQVDELITEMQLEEKGKSQSDAEFIKNTLTRLAEDQPLSLLPLDHSLNNPLNNQSSSSLAQDATQPAILVQAQHYGHQLNTELLQAWYPDTAKVHYKNPQTAKTNNKSVVNKTAVTEKTLSAQAAPIRRYLTEQQRLLKQEISSNLSSANTAAVATETRRLSKLLTAILALNDEQLLALFKPIDDIYLDISFGKGRISVLTDSDSFANPNPNLDLPKAATDRRVDDRTHLDTPLATWLTSSYYVTLLSADNAAWLIDLTQDSSQVWIFPHVDIDPLPVMLWRQARPALLGLALLALLWLWSLFNRFGKMTHLPDDQAHDILRYFRQVGRFGWQQDRALRLMTITRDRVAKQLKERQLGDSLRLDTFSLAKSGSNDAHLATDFDMTAIHQFLITQLEQKTQQLGKNPAAATASNTDTASDTERAGNGAGETAVGDLLVSNQAFIRGLIAPERLRAALVPAGEVRHSAVELTQMTQTLWTVQWLLK